VNVYSFQLPVQEEETFSGTDLTDTELSGDPPRVVMPGWEQVDSTGKSARARDTVQKETESEAERIICEARQRAAEILQEAEAQAKQMKEDALDEGYHEGYEKGFKEGVDIAVNEHGRAIENQMEEFGRDIETALAAVSEAKEKSLNRYLNELKDCAVAVAEKVIHISLKSSGDIIKRMIIAETERLKKTAWVKIYMEKNDYETMVEADEDVLAELSRLSDNIKFVVMEKDNRGDCIIEMPDEIIDISVHTQLENIKEMLQNIRI